jgi:general secretion pathway protein G
MRSRRPSGFTLIEVLIVVVIMAVLAATVIPQFANSTSDAKLSSLKFNLHTLRAQIELYKVHHDQTAPVVDGTTGTFAQLLNATNAAGTTGAPGPGFPFGPYILNEIPRNPFTNSNAIRTVASWPPAASGSGGWVYYPLTGQIAADDPDHIGL